MKRIAIPLLAIPLALTACEGGGFGTGGGQAIAIPGETTAGNLVDPEDVIGSKLGSLAAGDRAEVHQAFSRATTAPIGESIEWRNPDSGNRGTVTAIREGRTGDGRLCREYRTTLRAGGKYEEGHGTACRNSDGTWEMVT